MDVVIEGYDLPGRSCSPHNAGQGYANVHVGVQRKREVVDLFPGDAPAAEWSFEVTVRPLPDGSVDFGGPYVHGKRGERFLYLSWGVVDDAGFGMFRRAKLLFADAGDDVLAAAAAGADLRCRVRLTDGRGDPRCARVRPPDAVWSASA